MKTSTSIEEHQNKDQATRRFPSLRPTGRIVPTVFLLITTLVCILPLRSSAQTTDEAKELLRDGLFEEEANRNLTAAVVAYEKVVAMMDAQRELAATAVFRLGECYRKQGDNDKAAAQYRRILDEFADQSNLALLSHQNLNAIAGDPKRGTYGFYEVQPGDTILRIAHDAGTTTNQVHALNPGLTQDQLRINKVIRMPAKTVSNVAAVDAKPGRYGLYEVRPGDTLSKIAQDADTTIDQIAALNPGLDPERLRVGQIINVSVKGALSSLATDYTPNNSSATSELVRLKSVLETAKTLNAPNSREEYLLLGESFPHSRLIERLGELDSEELRLLEKKVTYTEQHDDVKTIMARINGLKKIIEDTRDSILKAGEAKTGILQMLANGGLTTSNDMEYARLKITLEMIEALNSPYSREEYLLLGEGFPESQLLESVQKRDAEEIRVAELKQRYREKWPAVMQSRARIEALTESIRSTRDSILQTARAKMTVFEVNQAAKGSPESATATTSNLTTEEQEELLRIEALAKRSPDLLSAPDDSGETPLHHAAKNGYLEVVKRLVAYGADVDADKAILVFDSNQGMTPLHFAAFNGHQVIVQVLLSAGADVNSGQGSFHPTPLHWAAYKGYLTIAELLLERGATVHPTTDNPAPGYTSMDEVTPLHLASGEGYDAMVELLLKNGANVERESGPSSPPPIYYAVKGNHISVVRLLLEHGASPNYILGRRIETHRRGRAAGSRLYSHSDIPILYDAVATGIEKPGSEIPMLELLLPRVDNIDLPDSDGETPLRFAIAAKLDRAAMLLLKAGANVNAGTSGNFETPLSQAVDQKNADLVRELLDAGAKTKANGRSNPLVQAGFTDVSILDLLLKYDPDLLNTETGRSAIQEAIYSQRPPFLEALIEHDPARVVEIADEVGAVWGLAGTDYRNEEEEKAVQVIFKRLLDIGANPNLVYNDNITYAGQSPRNTPPLIPAANKGKLEWVRILLEKGAEPNFLMKDLNTAYSIVQSHLEATEERQTSPTGPRIRGRVAATGPRMIRGRVTNPSSGERENYESILELLIEYGANPLLHRRQRISVSRSINRFEEVVFWRDEADWSEISLFELFNESFTVKKGNLDFPDFSRIVIHRVDRDSGEEIAIRKDVTEALMTGDCSADIPLEWGDRVEIPEAVHTQDEKWQGILTPEIEATLHSCVSRNVTLITDGSERVWKLARHNPRLYQTLLSGGTVTLADGSKMWGFSALRQGVLRILEERGEDSNETEATTAWFWADFGLESLLKGSRQLLTNSDLTRVEVTRTDKATGETKTHVFDASGEQSPRNLWLEDGDVIRVPSK